MVSRRSSSFSRWTGIALLAVFSFAGCGYTTKAKLPEGVQALHIEPIKNAIDLSTEVSDKTRFKVYRPGLEVDITHAITNRFVFDGNLRVVSADKADAVLRAKLIDYRRDPLRYTSEDDIQEYRLNVTIDAALIDARTQEVLWHETSLTGDATFFLSGSRAISEDEATAKAVEDLARRVVERTVELW